MDEYGMELTIWNALSLNDEAEDYGEQRRFKKIRPFFEANILTRNRGLVITLADGSEFQVTIVQSKLAEITE